MKLFSILSNLSIVLALCFLTFTILDWFNPMMNFNGNTISVKLLLLLCGVSIVVGLRGIVLERRIRRQREHQEKNSFSKPYGSRRTSSP